MEVTLSIKYKKNSGRVFSVEEILSIYLYGVTIQGSDGTTLSNETIEFYIDAMQKELENFINIKFVKQLFDETTSYYRTDYWQQFPILQTRYPVREPLSLTGFLNKIEQIIYPQQWLLCQRDSNKLGKRRISVVPNGASTAHGDANIVLTGITAQLGFQAYSNIPDYWDMQYITGFDIDQLPSDLLNILGKLISIQLFNIAGDLVLGAGIASSRISIDGLSQDVQTTSSAENSSFSARIIQYKKDIEESLKRIKLTYDQIKFMSM